MIQTDSSEIKGTTEETILHPKAGQIINNIIVFLQLFMCETLAKRIVSLVLIALGVPNASITTLTGLCDRSIRSLKKAIETGDIGSLFNVSGGGRKSKLQDVEDEIIKEIEQNNYHSRQQIADMIQEKYGIKVSIYAIGRLLKKKKLSD